MLLGITWNLTKAATHTMLTVSYTKANFLTTIQHDVNIQFLQQILIVFRSYDSTTAQDNSTPPSRVE